MASNELAKKVPLELMCLLLLEERDMYGYEMLQEFNSRSGGRISVNITTLYMALKRLNDRGFVSIHYSNVRETRERTRLYYHLEPPSIPYKAKLLSEYQNMVLGVEEFLKYSSKGGESNG